MEPSNSAKTENESSNSLTNKYVNVIEADSEEIETNPTVYEDDDKEQVTETYEGVTSDNFTQFTEELTPTLQAIAASGVVIVWALFFCAGVLCVQTILRSLEG